MDEQQKGKRKRRSWFERRAKAAIRAEARLQRKGQAYSVKNKRKKEEKKREEKKKEEKKRRREEM